MARLEHLKKERSRGLVELEAKLKALYEEELREVKAALRLEREAALASPKERSPWAAHSPQSYETPPSGGQKSKRQGGRR